MAPEYAMRGHLTDKADVYSFGVVALEIVSGKSNTNYRPSEEFVYLLDWACVLQERGTLLDLIDPNLGSDYSKEEAMLMLQVSLLCTNASPTLRPSMSKVVSLLQGLDSVQPLLPVLSRSANGSSSNGIRRHFWQNVVSESVSIDPTFTDSSESRLEDDGSVRPIQGSINILSTSHSSSQGITKNFRQHLFETKSMTMYRTCTESFESLSGDDEGVRPLQGSMSSVY